jgi:hypothetical protein
VRALALTGLAVAVLVFALGDTAWIVRGDVLPALLMAAGLVAATGSVHAEAALRRPALSLPAA